MPRSRNCRTTGSRVRRYRGGMRALRVLALAVTVGALGVAAV
ncbi:MAG: hypothetical protein RL219_65, partial [Actinomycetota bacterium]